MRKILIYFFSSLLIMFSLTGCTLFNDNNSSKDEEVSSIDKNNQTNTTTPSSDVSDNGSQNAESTNLTNDTNSADNLDNEITNWFYMPNKTHTTPNINPKLNYDLSTYNSIYNGPTNENEKVLYLTFDEGYENGQTPKILDTLKEKNVKAVFFVTYPFVQSNPDLVKRMTDEGHIVASHSKNHLSMPTLASDSNEFAEEFKAVEEEYTKVTGKELTKFFRPPMGCYSEKTLAMTKELGYTTVFWSFAYEDWDPEKQPEPGYSKEKILSNLHNGSILLLHAVSQTNADILGDVIDSAVQDGYSFKLLDK
ncbi:MAG: delta-lactam-biosynthetic de-N-acetylase [Peptostreptococcaceae bacterium]